MLCGMKNDPSGPGSLTLSSPASRARSTNHGAAVVLPGSPSSFRDGSPLPPQPARRSASTRRRGETAMSVVCRMAAGPAPQWPPPARRRREHHAPSAPSGRPSYPNPGGMPCRCATGVSQPAIASLPRDQSAGAQWATASGFVATRIARIACRSSVERCAKRGPGSAAVSTSPIRAQNRPRSSAGRASKLAE